MNKKASANPLPQLQANMPTAPISFKKFQLGYTEYFNMLPEIFPQDSHKELKLDVSNAILEALGLILMSDVPHWIKHCWPIPGDRDRTTLAIEEKWQKNWAGAQIVVGRWSKGHLGQIHGHAAGITFEQVIVGKVLNERYELLPDGKLKLTSSEIMGSGEVFSGYGTGIGMVNFIHRFTALENTATLHYLAEYDRDWNPNYSPLNVVSHDNASI